MDKIRFRAKTLKGNSWAYGYPELFNNCLSPATAIMHYFSDWSLNMSVEVRPETISQYTGVNDKNKKEIFAGDVITDSTTNSTWVVTWDEESTGWCSATKYGKYHLVKSLEDCFEVIGNIYDNPELAKEEKNEY